jgi:hypothetical protein
MEGLSEMKVGGQRKIELSAGVCRTYRGRMPLGEFTIDQKDDEVLLIFGTHFRDNRHHPSD